MTWHIHIYDYFHKIFKLNLPFTRPLIFFFHFFRAKWLGKRDFKNSSSWKPRGGGRGQNIYWVRATETDILWLLMQCAKKGKSLKRLSCWYFPTTAVLQKERSHKRPVFSVTLQVLHHALWCWRGRCRFCYLWVTLSLSLDLCQQKKVSLLRLVQ